MKALASGCENGHTCIYNSQTFASQGGMSTERKVQILAVIAGEHKSGAIGFHVYKIFGK